MFESLFAKTFTILGSQLVITFLGAVAVLRLLRYLHNKGVDGITATTNEAGDLDLHMDNSVTRPYVWPLLVANFGLFFVLLFVGIPNPVIGVPVFTLWSLVMGAMLGLAVVRIDENFAARVLGITASITFICALIGIYSGIRFSAWEGVLFLALLALLLANTIRLFVKVGDAARRLTALFGVLIFIGYLLVDFARLAELEKAKKNSWSVAMDLAINIYLDIINLFLELLDLLSESS